MSPGVPGEARSRLLLYPWPGNVRQVEAVAEQAAILARGEREVRAEHLEGALGRGMAPGERRGTASIFPERPEEILALQQLEEEYALHALRLLGNSVRLASKAFGVSESTIYRVRGRSEKASNRPETAQE